MQRFKERTEKNAYDFNSKVAFLMSKENELMSSAWAEVDFQDVVKSKYPGGDVPASAYVATRLAKFKRPFPIDDDKEELPYGENKPKSSEPAAKQTKFDTPPKQTTKQTLEVIVLEKPKQQSSETETETEKNDKDMKEIEKALKEL